MLVEFVSYKGEQLPVRISYYVLSNLNKKGISISDIDTDISKLTDVFYLAYISGCKAEERVPKYKEEDVEDILDSCYMDFLGIIPSFFSAEELGADGEKKN